MTPDEANSVTLDCYVVEVEHWSLGPLGVAQSCVVTWQEGHAHMRTLVKPHVGVALSPGDRVTITGQLYADHINVTHVTKEP